MVQSYAVPCTINYSVTHLTIQVLICPCVDAINFVLRVPNGTAENRQDHVIFIKHDTLVVQFPIPVKWKFTQSFSTIITTTLGIQTVSRDPSTSAFSIVGNFILVTNTCCALIIIICTGAVIVHVVLLCYPGKEAG